MKLKTLLLASMAAVGLSLTSCSGLGFGVDVDSGGVSPYFYGNNYFGPLSVGASWSGGPIGGPLWGTTPPPPPVIGNGPGSIGMVPAPSFRPQPSRPPQSQPQRPQPQPQPSRPQPSYRPAQNFGPSSQAPLEVGPDLKPINNGAAPANRPGNNGLPN